MLQKSKVALQGLAKRLREWSLGQVPKGWREKLGQLKEKISQAEEKVGTFIDRFLSEPARARRVWFVETMWESPLFRGLVYLIIIYVIFWT